MSKTKIGKVKVQHIHTHTFISNIPFHNIALADQNYNNKKGCKKAVRPTAKSLNLYLYLLVYVLCMHIYLVIVCYVIFLW